MSTEDIGGMHEVSGQGVPSHSRLSDQTNNNNQCDECAESGKTVCAAGFCKNCTDFLCKACISQHKIIRSSRNHEILFGKDMPKQKPDTSDVEKCAIHSDRPVEAYCAEDDTFCCSLCTMIDHRSCQNVDLLSDLSRGVQSSKEFLDVQKAANIIKTIQDEFKQAIAMHLSINDECYTNTLESFQQFRSMFLSILEEIGEKVHKEADKLRKENERQLTKFSERLEQYSNKLIEYVVKIDGMKDRNQDDLVFMALKKTGRRVTNAVQRLKALPRDIIFKTFNFHSDPGIKNEIINSNTFQAKIASFPSVEYPESLEEHSYSRVLLSASPPTTCKSVSTIKIKADEDMSDCLVIGLLQISPDELILTDWGSSCLKLFDTSSNTIIQKKALRGQPWGITNVPGCRLAVSFPSLKQIQVFTADHNLDFCGSIYAFGDCHGLHCTGDRMIVSYIRPAQVKILDMTGKVLRVIEDDASGNGLFREPFFFAVSHDNKLIHISDHMKNTITCMDTNGDVQWVYKDTEMKGPGGVITGERGCLFICSLYNDTIHVVSHDGVRLAVMPNSQTGVKRPRAVSYSSLDRTLYVSSMSVDLEHRNFIKIISLQ